MKPYDLPDERGHFGAYGGIFVAETLMHALAELNEAYAKYRRDPEFVAEYRNELAHFVGRPSPTYHARRWSEMLGGAQIFLKREDLNHTGAHKVNNTGSNQNQGGYSNPELDALLEAARIEQDVTKRIEMYQQANKSSWTMPRRCSRCITCHIN